MITRLLICLVLMSIAGRAADWNAGTGGNSARNSSSSEFGPLTPDTLWHGSLSAVVAQPAVIENNLAAMSRMFNINDVLHGTRIVVHDLTTGDTLWTRELPVLSPTTDWRTRVTAIRDGKVYATRSGNDNYSFVYALDAESGDQLWRSADSVNESSTESPAFAPDGDLIVGSIFSLVRINSTDGARVWRTARVSPTSGGSEAAVFADRVYIWEQSGQGPRIKSFNLDSGTPRYSSPALGGLVQQVSLFVGPDGTVYASRTQNNPVTDYLVAFTDTDSSLVERWRVPLGYVPFGTFGVGPDGTVYSYSRDMRVIRIHPETGGIIDSSEILETDFAQPRMAIDSAGHVFVTNGGFSQGALYSFNDDLTLRWSIAIPNVNIGGPAIGRNGTMLVCGTGTNVIAFRGTVSSVDHDDHPIIAASPLLHQNYPNPFNLTTVIAYDLPHSMTMSLSVYDLLGREITTLARGFHPAGKHLASFTATDLSSGRYFYQLKTDHFQQTRQFSLLK